MCVCAFKFVMLNAQNENQKLSSIQPIQLKEYFVPRTYTYIYIYMNTTSRSHSMTYRIIPKMLQIKLLIEAKRAEHGHYDSRIPRLNLWR